MGNVRNRTIDYLITGTTMFGCGVLLEISYFAITAQLGASFPLMGGLMILFYISFLLFDFWDLQRNNRD